MYLVGGRLWLLAIHISCMVSIRRLFFKKRRKTGSGQEVKELTLHGHIEILFEKNETDWVCYTKEIPHILGIK